jgi:hypothetical protein
MKKAWKIEYKDGDWHSLHDGNIGQGRGYYEITFNDCRYGIISKEAWDEKKTGNILEFVEMMLNDAHSLATRINEDDNS